MELGPHTVTFITGRTLQRAFLLKTVIFVQIGHADLLCQCGGLTLAGLHVPNKLLYLSAPLPFSVR